MYETTDTAKQRALLVGIDTGEYDADTSLRELEELAKTDGIETAAVLIQKRPGLDTATALGEGKLEEASAFIQAEGLDMVIFDHELSATQLRNIEKTCQVPVIDRTMLILDIFAQRAVSSEGRLQVELARQRYMLPRLAGMGEGMSRLGGGGGLGARRGKGETKLELDRRHVRRRIQTLEVQLRDLAKRREYHRARRKKDEVVSVAIVGYTNVGKSTLLNALTDAGVLAEDKLFATLDPASRALTLPDGRAVMLIDTVGLVRRLPHHLVEAFKSTLEEAAYADLILNVCDISSDEVLEQIAVADRLLQDLGAGGIPRLVVFNKTDLLPEGQEDPPFLGITESVRISAKTGYGLESLLAAVTRMLNPTHRRVTLLIPYDKGNLAGQIRTGGKVFAEEFTEDGLRLDAMVELRLLNNKLSQYFI